MSLRAKIFGMVNLLLALVLAAVGVSVLRAERQLLWEKADKRQQAALETIAGVLREADITRDPLLLVNYLKLIVQTHPEVRWLCVVDSDGRIQASHDLNLLGADRKTVVPPGELRLISEPVASKGVALGHVEVGFDKGVTESNIEVSLERLKARLFVIGLGALALGFVFSFLLAWHLSSPIRALSLAAAEIGRGKLDVAVPVNRRDELGGLARSFSEMGVRLQELDRMKQDFVASTTHELRSPLGVIESHANAILEDLAGTEGIPPETLRKDWMSSLKHIRVNAGRLRRFINALLDIAKIERGKLELNPQDVSLSEIVEEVGAFFAPQAEERGIELVCDIPPALPRVHADPERLHQVFVNLISNAFRFTPPEGKVEITAEAVSPKFVRVKVADSGPGIPKEFVGRLFNKFEQSKGPKARAREAGGTGLGLAICKGIVEKHGGEIGLMPGNGRGAAFYFTLPAAQA